MRRTRLTSGQIESVLRWFFFVALLAAALWGTLLAGRGVDLARAAACIALALVPPVLTRAPGTTFAHRRFLLSFIDLLVATGIYFIIGGSGSIGSYLIFPLIALAATRLVLENALILATIGSVALSLDLVPGASGLALNPNLAVFIRNLALGYGIALIIHFAITGQREAEVRRERESALRQAQRAVEQQRALVRLGRKITDTASLEQIVQIVLDAIHDMIPFKGGSVTLLDSTNQLYIAAAHPSVDASVRELRLPVGAGIAGWIVEKGEPFYSPDLDRETRVAPSNRNVGSNSLIKSFLGVPLLTRGRCIGVLQVDSAEPDAFTEEHQQLLQAVATQVSGVIENARLLEERERFSARLRQVSSVANDLASHFDLDFILDEFAWRARELLNTHYGAALVTDDQDQVDKFATSGVDPADREGLRASPVGQGLLRVVFQEQKPVLVEDVTSHPDHLGLPPNHPPIKNLLAVPLVAHGDTKGAIYLANKRDSSRFTQEDQELLLILAAGASAAISNAQLYSQLRRNIEQLYALHQIGQAIGSSLAPEEVFSVFNLDVRHLCSAEASVISEWNTAGNSLAVQVQDGDQDLLQARDNPEVRQQIDKAARSMQASSLEVDTQDGQGKLYGYLAPLVVRGRGVGLAEVYSHNPGVVSTDSSSIFVTLAAQLAVSMENARLYTELKKREKQLRNFVGRLFLAEDGERRRLAYDIHDGLAQLIVSADMHMNNFASMRGEDPELAEQQLDKGLKRLKTTLTEVRRVVSELRPSTLDDFGLINTLRRYVEQLAEEQGWDYSFEDNLGETRLDTPIENGAYRIVQEALSNIRKYSNTPRVEVEIKEVGDELHIRVQDWGRGFDLEEARQREGHFGLSSMEERTRLLGGTFVIDTRPGEGTRIDVSMPCYHAMPSVQA